MTTEIEQKCPNKLSPIKLNDLIYIPILIYLTIEI